MIVQERASDEDESESHAEHSSDEEDSETEAQKYLAKKFKFKKPTNKTGVGWQRALAPDFQIGSLHVPDKQRIIREIFTDAYRAFTSTEPGLNADSLCSTIRT